MAGLQLTKIGFDKKENMLFFVWIEAVDSKQEISHSATLPPTVSVLSLTVRNFTNLSLRLFCPNLLFGKSRSALLFYYLFEALFLQVLASLSLSLFLTKSLHFSFVGIFQTVSKLTGGKPPTCAKANRKRQMEPFLSSSTEPKPTKIVPVPTPATAARHSFQCLIRKRISSSQMDDD